jgi:hypothetical protein
MYTTTRNIAGGTFTSCNDCGEAISMNKLCETPFQSATNMLKHMAVHNASRAFAVGNRAGVESVIQIERASGFDTPAPADCVVAQSSDEVHGLQKSDWQSTP